MTEEIAKLGHWGLL